MKVVDQAEPLFTQVSPTSGWLVGADARAVGLLSQGLGAGRALPDDVCSTQ